MNEPALSSSAYPESFLDHVPLSTVMVDGTGQIIYANQKTAELFGYTRQELTGQPMALLLPERYRSRHASYLSKFLANPSPRMMGAGRDLVGLRRDGTEVPLEIGLAPMHREGGTVVIAYIIDLTERQQMAQALKQFKSTLDQTWDCVFIFRTDDLRFIYVNRGAMEQVGYSEDELFHMTPVDIKPEFNEAGFRAILQPLLDGKLRIHRFETVHRHKNGAEIPVEIILQLITPTGEQPRFIAIARDIVERIWADKKNREQLERMNLLDKITQGIGSHMDMMSILQEVIKSLEHNLHIGFGCVCLYEQPDGVLRTAHIGAQSLPLARKMGLAEHVLVNTDDANLSRCMAGEFVYEPDNGSRPDLHCSQLLASHGQHSVIMAPLRTEDSLLGMLIVTRNEAHAFSSDECTFLRQLSEHVALAIHHAQLYNALQQAYDNLRRTRETALQQERLRALGQVASGVAHDINNAVSSVPVFIDLLLETEQDLSARGRGFLEIIQRAVQDVAHTIDRMRDFYRQREPQQAFVPIRLNQLASEVLEFCRVRYEAPQQHGIIIQVRRELAPDLPEIMGIESELREALVNLIFNAVDALPEGGTIILRTRCGCATDDPDVSSVIMEVIDDGTGMDKETLQRCMEPFFTTKGEQGTGLGMALVYGAMQRHGAGFKIESAPGAGTCVRLSFPAHGADSAAPEPAVTTGITPQRMRLLLVDDDQAFLDSLRLTLEADGHDIVAANSGRDGIDIFRAAHDNGEPFSAVVTDLGMPAPDGYQVAAAIKAVAPTTPVILLTGQATALLDDGNIPPQIDRVLGKPLRVAELREIIPRCCRTAPAGPVA